MVHIAGGDDEDRFRMRENRIPDCFAELRESREIPSAERDRNDAKPGLPDLQKGQLDFDGMFAGVRRRIFLK